MKYLNPQEQQEVINYKNQYVANPNQQGSVHNVAEEIRAKYGYSGGGDGSQYIPIETYRPPTTPEIGEYESPYTDQVQNLMNQMANQKPYQSPYEDLINQSMSDLVNRPKFSYDPDSDEAYQAFLQRATRAGDKAYADNLGGLSAMTGGRANSWAGTVASQARNQYTLQAQEAVIQFEDRAYNRYQNETNDMYNLLGALNSQDGIAYGRYRDSIGDTQQLADMVLRLDERDFERFKFQSEQQWRVFDTEYQAYNDSLTFKQNKIAEAIDRTSLQGFVNNQDSITLGVPAGTLSQSARERAEQMEDYITKQQHDINQFRKEKEISHEFDLKLLNARESIAVRSGGGSSGGSSPADPNFIPTTTEANKITGLKKDFDSLISSDSFARLTGKQKHDTIADFLENIIADMEKNMYGKNSYTVGNEALNRVMATTVYQQYYLGYKQIPEVEREIGSITHPNFRMTDFLKYKGQ